MESDELTVVPCSRPQCSGVTDEPCLTEALAELVARQADTEGLVGHLETSVMDLRQALRENRSILEVLSRAASRLQEADARIKAAEFRLRRSVDTNIGLRRQIQRLKIRLCEERN